jgi:hypothetical protein
MRKQLQVSVTDLDYREIQRSAQSRGMAIAEWVRQALNLARRRDASTTGKKIAVVRATVRHAYPTGDIDIMLAEIESNTAPARDRTN